MQARRWWGGCHPFPVHFKAVGMPVNIGFTHLYFPAFSWVWCLSSPRETRMRFAFQPRKTAAKTSSFLSHSKSLRAENLSSLWIKIRTISELNHIVYSILSSWSAVSLTVSRWIRATVASSSAFSQSFAKISGTLNDVFFVSHSPRCVVTEISHPTQVIVGIKVWRIRRPVQGMTRSFLR